MLGAGLGGDDVGGLVQERRVPGGGHADGLRENRGDAGARDAVQTFVPIIIGGNAQPRNGRGGVAHLLDFFGERQPAHEVVHAGGGGLRGVLPDFRSGDDGRLQRAVVFGIDQIRRAHRNDGLAGGILEFKRVQLGRVGASGEDECERPVRCIAGKINPVGQQEDPARAAGGGENVKIARERLVAAGDVKRALAGVGENHFRQPDFDCVFARRKIGDGQREIRSVNFLAERFFAAPRRAFDRQAFVSPAVVELAADHDLPVAGHAGFLVGEGDAG